MRNLTYAGRSLCSVRPREINSGQPLGLAALAADLPPQHVARQPNGSQQRKIPEIVQSFPFSQLSKPAQACLALEQENGGIVPEAISRVCQCSVAFSRHVLVFLLSSRKRRSLSVLLECCAAVFPLVTLRGGT